MSAPAPLRVLGDDDALAIAGPPERGAEGPVVHLGPATEPADVVWLPTVAPAEPATAGTATAGTATPRVIATGGEGLWSRAPWPAADALFGLEPPAGPRVLLVGAAGEARDHVVAKLAERTIPAAAAERLTAAGLRDAAAVVLLGEADAPLPEAPLNASAMPGEAPAVLAARRLLIAPRCATGFGLLAGSDHLAFSTADDVVQYADAVLTFPRAFEPLRVLGAVAAERHRASTVYARLAAELRSAPRSAGPRG